MPNPKSKNYCFTSYESDGSYLWGTEVISVDRVDEVRTRDWRLDLDRILYIVWGDEICPTSGRPHKQGYLELKDSLRISAVQKLLGTATMHLEERKGSQEEAIAYCKKDGKFTERGKPKQQGKRTDLESIREKIVSGTPMETIADEHFSRWCVYNRSFEKYAQMKMKRDSSVAPKVIFLHGPSGCGKTRLAFENGAVDVGFDGKFMLSYKGEEVVLFDDVDAGTFPDRSYLLKLMDRYPMNVSVKGSQIPWMAKVIYITSNFTLEELGWNAKHAMRRRITEVIKMNGPDDSGPKVVMG